MERRSEGTERQRRGPVVEVFGGGEGTAALQRQWTERRERPQRVLHG